MYNSSNSGSSMIPKAKVSADASSMSDQFTSKENDRRCQPAKTDKTDTDVKVKVDIDEHDTPTTMNDSSSLRPDDQKMIDEMFSIFDTNELEAAMQAERDVLGSLDSQYAAVPSTIPPPHVIEQALQGFQNALRDLPDDRKRAYLRAMELNPQVVQIEAHPKLFLLATNYDFWAAAAKYADYWNYRQMVYGDDKFSLPLRLPSKPSHATALSEKAIVHIRSGLATLASTRDAYNRLVVINDRAIYSPVASCVDTLVQAYFYMLHTWFEDPWAIVNGAVCMMTMDTAQNETHQAQSKSPIHWRIFHLPASEVIPIRFRSFHVVSPNASNDESSIVQQTAQAWLQMLDQILKQSFQFMHLRFRIHTVGKVDDRVDSPLQQLSPFGFSKDHLPPRFGGTLDPHRWTKERTRIEEERYKFLDGPATNSPSSDDRKRSAKDHSFTDNRNALLKRKMAEVRESNQIRIKRQHVAQLQKQQASLVQEHQHLQALLLSAQNAIEMARLAEEQTHRELWMLEEQLGQAHEADRLSSFQEELRRAEEQQEHAQAQSRLLIQQERRKLLGRL